MGLRKCSRPVVAGLSAVLSRFFNAVLAADSDCRQVDARLSPDR
jgi:hypothetical protein